MSFSVSRPAGSVLAPLAIALAVSSIFSFSSFAQVGNDQSLEPVLVTATRTTQKASDVLSDNVVITSEEIQQSGQTSLVDLLQRKRGVEISRNGGAGANSSVYLRGSSAKQVVLLIDGVRTQSGTLGEPTWSTIPLSEIDRIEIVYGPMGSIYGADAVGGVIQVFTKKGDGSPRLRMSAGAGTWGTNEFSLGVSGSTNTENVIRYSFNTSKEKSEGFDSTTATTFPDKDGYTKTSNSGQISWELAKGHELGFSFLNSRNESEYDVSGSGNFNSYRLFDVDVYSLNLKNQITKNWSSLINISRSYDENITYEVNSTGSRIRTKASQTSWQNDLKIGADTLQAIVEHRNEQAISGVAFDKERNTDSLALAYHILRNSHLASASVRYDDNSAYGSKVTGSVGYGYHFSDSLRVSGSYGTSFRAPTFNDLYASTGNLDVKPEEGKNAEVGLYYDDGLTDFTVAYYRNRLQNMIVSRLPCPNGESRRCAYNVSDALLTGVSSSIGRRFGNLRLFGTLDLQNPKDLSTDKLLDRRARYHGSVGASYVVDRYTVGADVNFSGHRFNNSTNTQYLGGYALLNLQATYSFDKDWQIFGRWNNALDKKYELATGYRTPGSNIFVGIRYGFR